MKKVLKFLTSMKFALILLVILAAACAAASAIPQGETSAWYMARYSERTAGWILALRLDDAFHSWWFILISAFLSLNLIFCSILRLPEVLKRIRRDRDWVPEAGQAGGKTVCGVSDPEKIFTALRIPAKETPEMLYGQKNRIGVLGSWICHLGILLVIIGFSLGQMTEKEYAVYGVPGTTSEVGDTGLFLTIDDFRILLREDDTVEQYEADITVQDRRTADRQTESASISVNHPAALFGRSFYQNSTGWAAKITVLENGEFLQEETVCAGDYIRVSDKQDLVIFLSAFYPDLKWDREGMPYSGSGELKNPGYLYAVYYKEKNIGMNVLPGDEEITIDEYTVRFSEPQPFTLIQIKEDHFTFLALLGGIAVLLGLLFAFYLQPVKLWAVREEDGRYTVSALSGKGGALFYEQFLKAAKEQKGEGENAGS